eukprot:CAMPEP_0172930944 /NCGR_PEP_ID=MMETSP1075-20121228/219245_1 /TAXON_ID=2916 /ORGANISM="Ceratium fusus, Strain PA161109" /LENGTH=90 /DNA_ID=CAMNT_0013792257 /DNA_START=2477 /DNA_END=2745 /DNA_ORIENTATION=+
MSGLPPKLAPDNLLLSGSRGTRAFNNPSVSILSGSSSVGVGGHLKDPCLGAETTASRGPGNTSIGRNSRATGTLVAAPATRAWAEFRVLR